VTPERWSQSAHSEAFWFAARAHRGPTVPGSDISYLMHVSLVCMEVIVASRVEQGRDEDLAVQCALLHDTLEDTAATRAVEREFGGAVASGVAALSKDEAVAKELRMADGLRRIKEQPREVAMVKLADRITNLQPPPSARLLERLETYGR
jgi:(p)ppGpp synthase/HD superfamily hydrolase